MIYYTILHYISFPIGVDGPTHLPLVRGSKRIRPKVANPCDNRESKLMTIGLDAS